MSLTTFLKGNAKTIGVIEYAPSDRFLDEEGKPAKFKIRAISGKLDAQLRAQSQIKDLKSGAIDFDTNKYMALLMTTCISEPDLRNVELQDSYEVKNEVDLLEVMFTAGEYQRLLMKVQEVNGFTETYQEKVKQAKN